MCAPHFVLFPPRGTLRVGVGRHQRTDQIVPPVRIYEARKLSKDHIKRYGRRLKRGRKILVVVIACRLVCCCDNDVDAVVYVLIYTASRKSIKVDNRVYHNFTQY